MSFDMMTAAVHESAHAVMKWRLLCELSGVRDDAGFRRITIRTAQEITAHFYVNSQGRAHHCGGITEMSAFDTAHGKVPQDIAPEHAFASDARRKKIEFDIMVILAGGLAEARYCGCALEALVEPDGPASDDWRQAHELAHRLNNRTEPPDEILRRLIGTVSCLIQQPAVWAAIVGLAEALLKQPDRVITGDQALPLLAAAYDSVACTALD